MRRARIPENVWAFQATAIVLLIVTAVRSGRSGTGMFMTGKLADGNVLTNAS